MMSRAPRETIHHQRPTQPILLLPARIAALAALLSLALGVPGGALAQEATDPEAVAREAEKRSEAERRGIKIWIDQAELDERTTRAGTRKGSEPQVCGVDLAELSAKISPAVVNVIVTFEGGPAGLESLFDEERSGPGGSAQGSGFIIHPNGYVLTNHHVVAGADRIKVRMNDKREFEARVVGVDPETDVALMKITNAAAKARFPTLALGNSDRIRVGQQVLAVGNPLGLNHTVTSGIVSALGRKNLAPSGKDIAADFIQTDASINPGNSGGPLLGLDGAVIGINTAINRQGQGIGFAIPINIVRSLLPQLERKGFVVRSWLGIRVQSLDPLLAHSFGLKDHQGALVTEVLDNSPASRAGLQSGDIILAFGPSSVADADRLPLLVSTIEAGQSIPVRLLRDGKPSQLDVLLEALPDQDPPKAPAGRDAARSDETAAGTSKASVRPLAIDVKSLTDQLARQLGAARGAGVVVTGVGDGSPAQTTGLRARDVIVEIDDTTVAAPDDFRKLTDPIKAGQVVRFKLIRGGRVIYVAFER